MAQPADEFKNILKRHRTASGLNQGAIAERAGVARPNVVAHENGRREPRWSTGVRLLEATGATLSIDPPVVWSWTAGFRPVAVPSRLWRLEPAAALRLFVPGPHLAWSGPRGAFDLSVRSERRDCYELVIREGASSDIESVVDGVLLCDMWEELVLPREAVAAWGALVGRIAAGDSVAS